MTYKILNQMKKVLFLSLALLVAGASFADKKCCKDKQKGSCSKEAKACSKDEAKSCSKTAKADKATAEMPACCKRNVDQGKAACCAKKDHAVAAPVK